MILKNFIVFEGIDGSGTTTQINLLKEKLGEKCVKTAEPTSGETGLFLRKILKGEIKTDPKTQAFLFAADRCEHLYGENGVIKNTEDGKIVVSDRYLFSSLAYQSVSCGEELPQLLNQTFPLPEILFFFEINPEISLERVNERGETKEIFEKIEYQKNTALWYNKIITRYENDPDCKMKVIRIDASKSIEDIAKVIEENLR